MYNDVKPWYLSKTIWIAILQAIAGVITIIVAQDPSLLTVGWVATLKSISDVIIRLGSAKTIV